MKQGTVIREVIDWLVHIALAIAFTLLIVNIVGQFTVVQGSSMVPTLKHNSILVIEKLTQRFSRLRQGDIVVLKIPEFLDEGKTYAVKRIIATAGQHVTITGGKVFVDDEKLEEKYTNGSETMATTPHDDVTVPEGAIYVLGDNRLPGKSRDSRTFGTVGVDRVEGRVVFKLFPFSELGVIQ